MKSITRFTKNIRGNSCLNCGTQISNEANFCSKCGQVNDTNRLSVKQYFSEYLNGFFNFDNRFLKTIIPLIFKPGFVTKEYIEGRRVKYVNPFQLYLHITILFFLVVGIFNTIDKFKPIEEVPLEVTDELDKPEEAKMLLDSIKTATLKELESNDVQLDSSTLSLVDTGINQISINKDSLEAAADLKAKESIVKLNFFVDSILSDQATLASFKNNTLNASEKDTLMFRLIMAVDKKAELLANDGEDIKVDLFEDIGESWEEISKKGTLKDKAVERIDSILLENQIAYQVPLSLIRLSNEDPDDDQLGRLVKRVQSFMDFQKKYPKENSLTAIEKLGYEKTYLNVFLYTKSTDLNEAIEDPKNYGGQFVDRVLSRVSVALFFLLPLFTLMVTFIYIRRKYNYTENLVFVFHVQTVFFLLLLIFLIVNKITGSDIGTGIFLLTFMIYLYLAMRKFYEQGWFKTLIKYIILNAAFIIIASIGAVIISFLAFLI